jgi:hypothetical protein
VRRHVRVAEGEQYAGLVGSACASAGEHDCDAALILRPERTVRRKDVKPTALRVDLGLDGWVQIAESISGEVDSR